MPIPSLYLGTVFPGGVSVTTEGNSAVSAYGPILGAQVSVVAITVSASSSADTTFAVPGAAVNDPVLVGAPSAVSGDLCWQAYVPSANNLTLRLSNVSTIAANQTAQTWNFSILRRSFITRIL